MKQQHKITVRREIPENVLEKAINRLKAGGFKRELARQARYMIEDTTEVVNALGGRIEWER